MIAISEIKPAKTKAPVMPFDFTTQEKMTSSTSEMAKISFGFSNITSTNSFIFDAQPTLVDRPMGLQKKQEEKKELDNLKFELPNVVFKSTIKLATNQDVDQDNSQKTNGKLSAIDEKMSF
jgi:hypothetical protein